MQLNTRFIMNKLKKTLKLLNMFLVTLLLIALVSEAKAQSSKYKRPSAKTKKASAKNGKKKKSSTGKLDISDLEQKYWAPKDTDFSVVQNRTFTKEKKYIGSLQYGLPVNDGYSQGKSLLLTGSYFFNERHGVEVTYQTWSLEDSQLVDEFLNLGTNSSQVKPNHGKPNYYYGVGYSWVPVYAKVSLLGKRIVYLDIAITPTIGMIYYDQQVQDPVVKLNSFGISRSAFAYGFDVTQYYFVGKNFALRVDFRNKYFKEEVYKYNDSAIKLYNKTTTNSTISVGATVYF